MPNLPIISETIPDGSCPATYNELAQLLASHFFAVQGDGVGNQWIFSAAKPTAEQAAAGYGWFQLDNSGLPVRPYLFGAGAWLARHPMAPGQTIWVFQTIADITTYDGGSAGVVSPLTGPMFQLARTGNLQNVDDGSIISARFPIPAGTFPSGTVLAVGGTGGEETHALTVPEIPPHSHELDYVTFNDTYQNGNDRGMVVDETAKGSVDTKDTGGNTDVPPVVVGHNNVPPFAVGLLIQRTNRTHYLINA